MPNASFSVDRSPEEIADFVARLSSDASTREAFVRDPNGTLRSAGITVTAPIDGETALTAFDHAVAAEGLGGERAVAAFVAAGIRVGTRPAISVGVRVATGTPVVVRTPSGR